MSSSIDYSSPRTQFTFDGNKNTVFKKDTQNFINSVGVHELNTLLNLSFLDTFMSKGNIIEPHYHQNAAELVYCVSGCITVSIYHPFLKQLMQFTITPGQVVNVPQGWWHFIVAQVDHTHFLAIFDANTPEVILGSDLLKFTPPSIMARTYCIDEQQWIQTIAPVKPQTFIGPYKDCYQQQPYQQTFYHGYSHPTMPMMRQSPTSYPTMLS